MIDCISSLKPLSVDFLEKRITLFMLWIGLLSDSFFQYESSKTMIHVRDGGCASWYGKCQLNDFNTDFIFRFTEIRPYNFKTQGYTPVEGLQVQQLKTTKCVQFLASWPWDFRAWNLHAAAPAWFQIILTDSFSDSTVKNLKADVDVLES